MKKGNGQNGQKTQEYRRKERIGWTVPAKKEPPSTVSPEGQLFCTVICTFLCRNFA
jgi:hypothetical protein